MNSLPRSRKYNPCTRVAAGENNISALGPCSPGRLEANPRAAADHNDRLPGELWLAAQDLACETCKA